MPSSHEQQLQAFAERCKEKARTAGSIDERNRLTALAAAATTYAEMLHSATRLQAHFCDGLPAPLDRQGNPLKLKLMVDERAGGNIDYELRPAPPGFAWEVVVTFPDGNQKTVTGFFNEIEALAWIGSERQLAWLKSHLDGK